MKSIASVIDRKVRAIELELQKNKGKDIKKQRDKYEYEVKKNRAVAMFKKKHYFISPVV